MSFFAHCRVRARLHTAQNHYVNYQSEPGEEEIHCICGAVYRYVAKQVMPQDLVWSYAGIRLLFDDASASASQVTGEYLLDLESVEGKAPLLSVFGGKFTTYRCLAEERLERLKAFYPACRGSWTEHAALPGGDIPAADFEGYSRDFQRRHEWLPNALARHYARTCGTRTERMLASARSVEELG